MSLSGVFVWSSVNRQGAIQFSSAVEARSGHAE